MLTSDPRAQRVLSPPTIPWPPAVQAMIDRQNEERGRDYFDTDQARDWRGRWSKVPGGRGPLGLPKILSGLAAEARKAPTYEEFFKDFAGQIKHGRYYHWTDDPELKLDPKRAPHDASTMALGGDGEPGLMVTTDPEAWSVYGGEQLGYDPDYGPRMSGRPYLAVIDLSDVPRDAYQQVNRGFGNEFFVTDLSRARVEKVLPRRAGLADHRRFRAALEDHAGTLDKLRDLWERAHEPEGDPGAVVEQRQGNRTTFLTGTLTRDWENETEDEFWARLRKVRMGETNDRIFGRRVSIYDEESATTQAHLLQLRLLPEHLAQMLADQHTHITVGDRPLPELPGFEELVWEHPRGVEADVSWRDMVGVHRPGTNDIGIGTAQSGQGAPAAPLHEVGHALEGRFLRQQPTSPAGRSWPASGNSYYADLHHFHEQLFDKLPYYLQQSDVPGNAGGMSEFWADAFADALLVSREEFVQTYNEAFATWMENRLDITIGDREMLEPTRRREHAEQLYRWVLYGPNGEQGDGWLPYPMPGDDGRDYFDPSQPRDPRGRWTKTLSGAFAFFVGNELQTPEERYTSTARAARISQQMGARTQRVPNGIVALFPDVATAITAAQRTKAVTGGKLRVGISEGTAEDVEGEWISPDVNMAARVAYDGIPGDILSTANLPKDADFDSIYSANLKGIGPTRVARVEAGEWPRPSEGLHRVEPGFTQHLAFADMADFSGRAEVLGEKASAEQVRDFKVKVMAAYLGHGGRAVNLSTGDGVVAVFDDPAAALGAADEIAQLEPDLGYKLRTGLATGITAADADTLSGESITALVLAERADLVQRAGEPGAYTIDYDTWIRLPSTARAMFRDPDGDGIYQHVREYGDQDPPPPGVPPIPGKTITVAVTRIAPADTGG